MNHSTDRLYDGAVPGHWWHNEADGDRIVCDLCPRECSLKDGDRGFCFVRENRDGQMVLSTYGKSTGFCIDPIEKKPLNHFLPGTSVLSFGTAGCNLGCKFCQNWDISKSREVQRLSDSASPDQIANAATELGCASVAYTYNDPIIWAEYAIDTARACRERGVKSVAVTAGYISDAARKPFFSEMDAANVDLKSFSEDFYHKITYSHLQPVLDTLKFLKHETDCWFEITNLIIPRANDATDELRRMCEWILNELGNEVPIHFTAFHPDFRMTDRDRTSHEQLIDAYDIARAEGLEYVYVGNVHDVMRQSTYCPRCGQILIERDWHELGQYHLQKNKCVCGNLVPGQFQDSPGTWGRKRQPVRIRNFSSNTEPRLAQIDIPNKEVSMTSFALSKDEDAAVLSAANELIVALVTGANPPDIRSTLGEISAKPIEGIFVTLKRGEHLRGCCGMLGQTVKLSDGLVYASQRTAKEDTRLPPISPVELPHLRLDVTILGPAQKVEAEGEDRAKNIEIGKHGLRITYGNNRGLLLPSVATENGWNVDQFLEAVCRKAGIAGRLWRQRDAVLETFEGHLIEGNVESIRYDAAETVTQSDIEQLTALAANNVIALAKGATPMYVAPGVTDGTVNGIILSATRSGGEPLHWINFSVRPGIPLQSTLFKSCQTAAEVIRRQNAQIDKVSLAVLWDPALHGYTEDHDLEGVNPKQRAVIVMDGKRAAFAFDQSSDTSALVERALECEQFAHAGVYSVQVASSASSFVASTGPRAALGSDTRPAAVAGAFYPAKDDEREEMISEMIDTSADKRSVYSAMVPHAGLRFSGKIAGEVLSQIELPRDVIIIGPKHTQLGVEWAIAPHSRWQIAANTFVDANLELAKQIAGAVPGMELDAAAHSKEHSIEVELPLIAKLSPETRVTGIVMHGGSITQMKEAASAFGKLLKELDAQPLILISSDMNHYADDDETRRRDRLALDALATLDSEKLLATCKDNDISMCGQLPAAFVIEALKAAETSFSATEIAYGTSADVSGDKTRVVGYAGVVFS